MTRTRPALLASVLLTFGLGLAGCSKLLDFEDLDGLPCPCDPNHVCLIGSDTCFPRHAVEDFKSCDLGAERPDDLCKQNSICEKVNGEGLRCLPTCSPSNYSTPDSNAFIATQCPSGSTCWDTPRGIGVCSEGVCNDLPNDCAPPQQCVRFNGAGVCFTPCNVFQGSPLPCGGNQLCQPIGNSSVTACVQAGTVLISEPCDDVDMCAQTDQNGRRLACDKPAAASATDLRRCRAICPCLGGACDNGFCNTGAACVPARANVDPLTGLGLGVCLE